MILETSKLYLQIHPPVKISSSLPSIPRSRDVTTQTDKSASDSSIDDVLQRSKEINFVHLGARGVTVLDKNWIKVKPAPPVPPKQKKDKNNDVPWVPPPPPSRLINF